MRCEQQFFPSAIEGLFQNIFIQMDDMMRNVSEVYDIESLRMFIYIFLCINFVSNSKNFSILIFNILILNNSIQIKKFISEKEKYKLIIV